MLTNSIGVNRLRRLILAAACITGILTLGGRAALAGGEAEQSGARVTEAKQILANLGYWVAKVDSRALDASTRHAIVAFQKAEGLKRTGVLSADLLAKLRTAGRPA